MLEAMALFHVRDDGGQGKVMAWKRQTSGFNLKIYVRGGLDKFAEGLVRCEDCKEKKRNLG